jgi:hypothetical protein
MSEGNESAVPDQTGKNRKRILSVALAAGLLTAPGSSLGAVSTPIESSKMDVQTSQRSLPGPLVLKPASSLEQWPMQHDSHSSHGSHYSHTSHISGHNSHASHTSGS